MHTTPVVYVSDSKKPEATLHHNATKGEVGTADEMLQRDSTKAASKQWPLAAFFNLLDIICWDSFVIARDVGMTHSNRRDFLIPLGELLRIAERHKQAAASQPSQFAQKASTSRGAVTALPAGKITTC